MPNADWCLNTFIKRDESVKNIIARSGYEDACRETKRYQGHESILSMANRALILHICNEI